jgi:hypothetical protein
MTVRATRMQQKKYRMQKNASLVCGDSDLDDERKKNSARSVARLVA